MSLATPEDARQRTLAASDNVAATSAGLTITATTSNSSHSTSSTGPTSSSATPIPVPSTSSSTPTQDSPTRTDKRPVYARFRSSSRSSGSSSNPGITASSFTAGLASPALAKLNKKYSAPYHHSYSHSTRARSGSRPSSSAHGSTATPASAIAPRVLPFPDLSARTVASRDASRAGSPTRGGGGGGAATPGAHGHGHGHGHGSGSGGHTPSHSPRGSSTDVTLSGMLGLPPGTTLSRRNSSLALPVSVSAGGSSSMSGAVSWDGQGHVSPTPGRSTPVRRFGLGSTSPPAGTASPRSGSSTPHISFPSSTSSTTARPRAQTGPVSARPVVAPTSSGPLSILRTSTISPPPTPAADMRASTDPTPGPAPAQATVVPQVQVQGQAQALSIPSRAINTATPPPPPIEKDRHLTSRPSKRGTAHSPSGSRGPSADVPCEGSVPITPPPATQPLADHLYASFLKGECADVRLWVRKWGVSWKVHKIVLVQAGFFNSLFLGGFSETRTSSSRSVSRKGKERARDADLEDDWMGEDVELKFDDPNITRAAFDPHPRLHFPTSILPTPSSPLTPSFPRPNASSTSFQAARSGLPAQAQLATPHLLLSVLATSVYLGHHTLMREIMAIVLRTVGPCTVGRYLGFAIGDGVGEEEWEGQEDEPARGLEGVASPLPAAVLDAERVQDAERALERERQQRSTQVESSPHSHPHRDSSASEGKEEEVKVGSAPSTTSAGGVTRSISDASTVRGTPRAGGGSGYRERIDRSAWTPGRDGHPDEGDETVVPDVDAPDDLNFAHMPHFYGSISNKIGEACVCWLARWALDLLHVELAFSHDVAGAGAGDSRTTSAAPWRIFAHRGIPARFVRALLASDSFFVAGEMERYLTARAILDLRRRGWEAELAHLREGGSPDEGDIGLSGAAGRAMGSGAGALLEEDEDQEDEEEQEICEMWEEDEEQIGRVFADGVYYSHMSFEDLSTIARDIDPATHLPYAPLAVLQAAHWAAADLKARVTAHDSAIAEEASSPAATPAPPLDSSELGLALSSAQINDMTLRSSRRITPRGRVVSPPHAGVGGSHAAPKVDSSRVWASQSMSSTPAFGAPSGPGVLDAVYHPIPGDDTFRSGAGGLLPPPASAAQGAGSASGAAPSSAQAGFPGMPDLSGLTADGQGGGMGADEGGKKRAPPQSERTFFGLLTGARSAGEIASASAAHGHSSSGYRAPAPVPQPNAHALSLASGAIGPENRWTKTQPFRFSVEFWGVDRLAEKERLYSTTHFHAGSWWNVYVQTIRKKDKGTQLGIYLHRQSAGEGFPPASRPPGWGGVDGVSGREGAWQGRDGEDEGDAGLIRGVRALNVGPASGWAGNLAPQQAQGQSQGQVLEGYGMAASTSAASSRERAREVRSLSEGGIERSGLHRRGRSTDLGPTAVAAASSSGSTGLSSSLGQSSSSIAIPAPASRSDRALPRHGSIAAGLAQSLGSSFGNANAQVAGNASGSASASGSGSGSGGAGRGAFMAAGLGQGAGAGAGGGTEPFGGPGSASSTTAVIGTGTASVFGSVPGHGHGHGHGQGAGSGSYSMRRASSRDEEGAYRDARQVTRAYFSITCASALGTALIRFSSSPDSFTLSQSWGWKSSALRSEEYLAVPSVPSGSGGVGAGVGAGAGAGPGQGKSESLEQGVMGWYGTVPEPGPESEEGVRGGATGSLRATVVVGVI